MAAHKNHEKAGKVARLRDRQTLAVHSINERSRGKITVERPAETKANRFYGDDEIYAITRAKYDFRKGKLHFLRTS